MTKAMTIQTDSLGTFVDADDEVLDRVLSQLEPSGFVIVERAGSDEEAYAQAAAPAEGPQWVVEYRDGPHQHYQGFTDKRDVVREVLAGWAFGRDGWKDLVEWSVLDLGF